MSQIKTISVRTALPASQADVFRAVTDWETQRKWVYATKVRGLGDDSHKLGGKIEAFTGFGPVGFLDTMTITKWDPPRVCEVTHTGNVVKGSGLFEVSEEDGKTYFTWTEITELPFGIFGRLGWIIVGPLTKLSLQWSLRRFRSLLSQ